MSFLLKCSIGSRESNAVFCILFLVILIDVCLLSKAKKMTKQPGKQITGPLALSSLEKAVNFYSRNYKKVNLDSVYGVRTAEGALYKSIHSPNTNRISRSTMKRILRIYSKTAIVADKGYRHIQASKSYYFYQFKYLINKKFVFTVPYWSVNHTASEKEGTISKQGWFDEANSDKCISGVVGIYQNGRRKQCRITHSCWKLMSKKTAKNYALTHQALFIFFAVKRAGCGKEIVRILGSVDAWKKQLRHLGSKIHLEITQKYQKGAVRQYKDIFVEEIYVCQMLGIVECFNWKYVSLIIKWQDQSGCWIVSETESKRYEDEDNAGERADAKNGKKDRDVEAEAGEFENEDYQNDEANVITTGFSERMSEEKLLSNGCSSHLTGIAIGCLGMYVNWLVDSLSLSAANDRGYFN